MSVCIKFLQSRWTMHTKLNNATIPKYPNVNVQLVGNDGNAFTVLINCQRQALKAGVSEIEIQKFLAEAQSDNHDHLLQTCMRWFDCD